MERTGRKVGIITYAFVHNYGALLQCLALQRTVESMGHDVRVIDYRFPSELFLDYVTMSNVRRLTWGPLGVVRGSFGAVRRVWASERFRKEYLRRTETCYTESSLRRVGGDFDVLISGSDEIFRTFGKWKSLRPFFLSFGDPERQRLVSYAACCGKHVDWDHLPAEVPGLLRRYHCHAVRDNPTVEFVKRLDGREPTQVADPTLLFDFEKVVAPRVMEGDYVLLYGTVSEDTERRIRDYAHRRGWRFVAIRRYSRWADETYTRADPLEWMSLIKHARHMFTVTLHGTLFSVIFRRPFSIVEGEQPLPKVRDVLARLDLSDRLLASDRLNAAEEIAPVAYERAEPRIAAMRERSLQYLREALA